MGRGGRWSPFVDGAGGRWLPFVGSAGGRLSLLVTGAGVCAWVMVAVLGCWRWVAVVRWWPLLLRMVVVGRPWVVGVLVACVRLGVGVRVVPTTFMINYRHLPAHRHPHCLMNL